ncbi:MAG: guanylate kinase [Planctomycetes bacterium]|nr:guanylate kinase [Planctomycetota bacterium]
MADNQPLPGLLVVLSGPAGVGKTTVATRLLQEPDFTRSVSATTRPPREGEVNGRDYHFVSAEEFAKLKAANELVEYAEVFGRSYGTPKQPLRDAVKQNKVILLVIDVDGGKQVKDKKLDALLVFLKAPDKGELQRRLVQRGTENLKQQTERLSRSDLEIKIGHSEYDFVVVNDDLDRCVEQVKELIRERRLQLRDRKNAGQTLYPGLNKG